MTGLRSSRAKLTSSSTLVELTALRRKHDEETRRSGQSVLHGARPSLTAGNVQLIDPDGGAGRLEVFGETQGEFGILATVAEEGGRHFNGQAGSPSGELSWEWQTGATRTLCHRTAAGRRSQERRALTNSRRQIRAGEATPFEASAMSA